MMNTIVVEVTNTLPKCVLGAKNMGLKQKSHNLASCDMIESDSDDW